MHGAFVEIIFSYDFQQQKSLRCGKSKQSCKFVFYSSRSTEKLIILAWFKVSKCIHVAKKLDVILFFSSFFFFFFFKKSLEKVFGTFQKVEKFRSFGLTPFYRTPIRAYLFSRSVELENGKTLRSATRGGSYCYRGEKKSIHLNYEKR